MAARNLSAVARKQILFRAEPYLSHAGMSRDDQERRRLPTPPEMYHCHVIEGHAAPSQCHVTLSSTVRRQLLFPTP